MGRLIKQSFALSKKNAAIWHQNQILIYRCHFVTAYRSGAQKMLLWNYSVVQLLEALRYQPEGRGIDYRWRLLSF
jgi:hypothetical protein